jgi:hypothetical protein
MRRKLWIGPALVLLVATALPAMLAGCVSSGGGSGGGCLT